MTEQRAFRMPATGEAWRHYKMDLYTIVGLARDDKGDVMVVYTNYGWSLIQLAPLYTQPLARFLQEVRMHVPRFQFEPAAGPDSGCQYINPQNGKMRSDVAT